MKAVNMIFRPVMIAILLCCAADAQVATGTPAFGSFSGGPDVTNLGNLNVQLAVPVFSKPGRGIPFTYTLTFNNSLWTPTVVGGASHWQPSASWGWMAQTQ